MVEQIKGFILKRLKIVISFKHDYLTRDIHYWSIYCCASDNCFGNIFCSIENL